MDVNPYMIKYDYDIAAALSKDPKARAMLKTDCTNESRKRFSFIAYKELLVDCSERLCGG